ncbi:hypothetical protein EVAR_32683_1 [Eumeta japonica]|uniref:Uncharacterized protein n=1 Tax=Eumeta variegata TaxID=151549 RepID=A0A4C1VQ26_EUMVA|nr:hypothetical protein EVAR_32683_1 [Eumeta japonica]
MNPFNPLIWQIVCTGGGACIDDAAASTAPPSRGCGADTIRVENFAFKYKFDVNFGLIGSYGIIPLKIPASPATHCTLHTTVGCVGNEDCTARSHSVIRLLGPVRDVIVKPARHHYRPGETITFWILALDHDLRLVRGELGYIALSDPAGTRVTIWDQLSMDEAYKDQNWHQNRYSCSDIGGQTYNETRIDIVNRTVIGSRIDSGNGQ